jgi:Family of unknown function (DUF6580)
MLAYLFVLLAIASRFLPHPDGWVQFTPLGAALLYFGARVPLKRMWIPLVALIAADVYLTKVTYAYPLTADQVVTWVWYAGVIVLGGALLGRQVSPLRVAAGSLTASIAFFVVSNFAVWAVWNMYPRTLAGLATAYVAAIPFFRNQVLADLLFAGVLFGIGALIERRESKPAPAGIRAA